MIEKSVFTIADIALDFGNAPFGTDLKTKDYVDSGIPVVQGRNIQNNRFEWNHQLYVSPEKFKSLRYSHCRAGDIAFPKVGTIGGVAIMPRVEGHEVYLLSTNMMRLTINPEIADKHYVYYYLCLPSVRDYIRAVAGGSSQPIFNFTTLKTFEIELPDLSTQHRIASILSAYDDLIENNTQRIKALEAAAQALYREWFVEMRFPGHESARWVGSLPEGWELLPLTSLVVTQYGYTESAQDKPVGPKFLRGMDINKNPYVDWSSVPYCPMGEDELQKYRLSVGDIVVIRMADPGKVGIVEKDIDAVFASYLIRLLIKSEKLTPYYLFTVIASSG